MAPREGGKDIGVNRVKAEIIDKANKKGEDNGAGKNASESLINENGFMTIEDIMARYQQERRLWKDAMHEEDTILSWIEMLKMVALANEEEARGRS